ncbi:hypothetical protein ABW19_dt0207004 [Dactylella cylindrospora]|nr:hypothetical protein ABW19_dt0207004 [Dactylella cylindrospora]
MPKPNPPLSTTLPPLLLGTAAFNSQYNQNPFSLPTSPIIHRFLTSLPNPGFDTSPYYGPAEILLGRSLKSLSKLHGIKRESYFIATKIGRIAGEEFDYSDGWIRRSIERSLRRLGTEYLDLVYCHDVEFVTEEEVVSAVGTLRALRDEGKVRYIGISGYPVDVLADLAERVKERTGEPLDAVMSYGNYTVQNTRLYSRGLERLRNAGVECVPNASPLGMGLLRSQGVPIGSMGDFHPSSDGLRQVCMKAAEYVEGKGGELEEVAYRWALDSWADLGETVGTDVGKEKKVGVTVIGVSYLEELQSILDLWKDVLDARDGVKEAVERRKANDKVVEGLRGVFGEWYDNVWESPGESYARRTPPPERFLSDKELWPELMDEE